MAKKKTNEWDKYLTKDLSETEPYKSILSSNVNLNLQDLEWIKIGIGRKADFNFNEVYPPEVATSWPDRLRNKNEINPMLVFKRKSNQKVYLSDINNIIFKLKDYQDQIENNCRRINIKRINDVYDKTPSFTELDNELERMDDFTNAILNNKIEDHILHFYNCSKVIGLKEEEVFLHPEKEISVYNVKRMVKPFYMLIYQTGVYKILSLQDIKYGQKNHLLVSGFNKSTEYEIRRLSLNPGHGISKVQIDCEKIVKIINNGLLSEPKDVITKFYYDTEERNKTEIGIQIMHSREKNYIESIKRQDMSSFRNRHLFNMSKKFEIIHIKEMNRVTNQADVYIKRINGNGQPESYKKDIVIDEAEKTHTLLPIIEFGKNKNFKIIGFDFVLKD